MFHDRETLFYATLSSMTDTSDRRRSRRKRKGRVRRVAVMLDLKWLYRHHQDVFLGTQQYARERGNWECVVDEFAHQSLHSTPGETYDGVIARATSKLSQRARRRGIPVVNVWHNSPAEGLPAVYPDFDAAGRLSAEHLLQRGLRRFACLLHPRGRTHRAFYEGFRETVTESGFPCRQLPTSVMPARNERTWQRFRQAVDGWIGSWQPPVGVFVAFHDFAARYLAEACRRHGLRVPEDVAIVVAGDEAPICLQPPPTLTGIDLGYRRVGYEAAMLLDRLMEGSIESPEPIVLAPRGLIARQSTDFFATEDETVAAALRFIATHLTEPLSVDDVARAVHISRRSLERRFRIATGIAVAEEIRHLRIERAKRLLLDTDLSVKQVAQAAGFTSSMQLYQVFRRQVGEPPSSFRAAREG